MAHSTEWIDIVSVEEALAACKTCGLIQRVTLKPNVVNQCARCGFNVSRCNRDSMSRTFAFALSALILYFPANLFPIVTTDYWGAHEATTIFDGIQALFQKGNYFVASLVFTTSILTPGIKIIGLLLCSLTLRWHKWQRVRTWTYKTIQTIDPWNMLEVTLLAILVSIAELGQVATVHPGAGVFSFAGVVVLTIAATLTFDPRLIWEPDRAYEHEGPPG
jgi:paraquat-inducible protein A